MRFRSAHGRKLLSRLRRLGSCRGQINWAVVCFVLLHHRRQEHRQPLLSFSRIPDASRSQALLMLKTRAAEPEAVQGNYVAGISADSRDLLLLRQHDFDPVIMGVRFFSTRVGQEALEPGGLLSRQPDPLSLLLLAL